MQHGDVPVGAGVGEMVQKQAEKPLEELLDLLAGLDGAVQGSGMPEFAADKDGARCRLPVFDPATWC